MHLFYAFCKKIQLKIKPENINLKYWYSADKCQSDNKFLKWGDQNVKRINNGHNYLSVDTD